MPQPKYLQIEQELRREIASGKFEYGDRFYSESELAKRYGVSSITVIHAIRDLVNAGYLVRHQGRGTFISRARKNQPVQFNDVEIFSSRSEEEHVEVLSVEEERNPEVMRELGLVFGETYHRIVRLRMVADEPYHLQVSAIPSRYIRRDVEPSYYSSIYTRFAEDFGIRLYNECFVEKDEILFPAPAEVASRLWPDGGAGPVVRQEKKTTLASGEVVEYVVSFKKWNYYKIEFSSCQTA